MTLVFKLDLDIVKMHLCTKGKNYGLWSLLHSLFHAEILWELLYDTTLEICGHHVLQCIITAVLYKNDNTAMCSVTKCKQLNIMNQGNDIQLTESLMIVLILLIILSINSRSGMAIFEVQLNSKFLWIFGNNPIITCLKCMVNSNTANSKFNPF